MIPASRSTIATLVLSAFGFIAFASHAQAQLDRIYPEKGNAVAGVVKTITKDEVTIQVGGNAQKFPTNTIKRIAFEGDPGPMNQARNAILEGQYADGLTELNRIDASKVMREESAAELMFYKAFAQAKLALSGREALPTAVTAMLAFVKKYPDSWHFYEAAEALGDMAMALGSSENAARYYSALANSPFPENKLKAGYLEGLALLKSNKPDEAAQRFNAVAGAQAPTPDAVRYQKMAKIGAATALIMTNKVDQALQELGPLIEQNDPADIEVSARLYNAHGMALAKQQDFEGATLAFLHTDLLFSAAADAHTEALRQLIDLWNKLAQPDRAAATRTRGQQLYPGAKF